MRVPTRQVGNKKGVRSWSCPLQNRLSWGHFTRFWGQNNYPQWSGTRPGLPLDVLITRPRQTVRTRDNMSAHERITMAFVRLSPGMSKTTSFIRDGTRLASSVWQCRLKLADQGCHQVEEMEAALGRARHMENDRAWQGITPRLHLTSKGRGHETEDAVLVQQRRRAPPYARLAHRACDRRSLQHGTEHEARWDASRERGGQRTRNGGVDGCADGSPTHHTRPSHESYRQS